LFCEISANTKISNFFRVKFEYEKKVLSFAKMENPEKNPSALPYYADPKSAKNTVKLIVSLFVCSWDLPV